MTSNTQSETPRLWHLAFNQEADCFSVSMDNGFRILNCDPLAESKRVEFQDGGIGITEMVFRTNYLALVGGGRLPKFAKNKVILWDDAKGQAVVELEFRNDIKAVKLRRDRLVVVLSNKVFVYTLSPCPQKLFSIETGDNDFGVCALCSAPQNNLLVVPGRKPGHVQLLNLQQQAFDEASASASSTAGNRPIASSSSSQPPPPIPSTSSPAHPSSSSTSTSAQPTTTSASASIIQTHNSAIACLALSRDGTRLATASIKGTIIRIHDTTTGHQVAELRRGSDHACIYCIAFSSDARRVVVASDTGTIHVFNVMEAVHEAVTEWTSVEAEEVLSSSAPSGLSDFTRQAMESLRRTQRHPVSLNRQSSLSFMKELLPKYFSSQWSFAYCRVPPEVKCLCAFGADDQSIYVLTYEGAYYKFALDVDLGGECRRVAYYRFLSLEQD